MSESETKAETERLHLLDMLRGVAILLMMVFHFCYDLNFFGYIHTNFEFNSFWIHFRELIVSMFLLIAGICMTLSQRGKTPGKSYFRRLGLLVLYSCLITLTTWIIYPQFVIIFGILHLIAVASILGLVFLPLGILNVIPALAVLLLPLIYTNTLFDTIWLEWIGLGTTTRPSLDHAHLFPWFGVYLLGMALGVVIQRIPVGHWLRTWRPGLAVSQWVCFTGRHSLHIYIIHQPVFMALIGSVYYLQFYVF